MTSKDFCDQLRTWRKSAKLKQDVLAKLIGCERSNYARKERGEIPFSLDEALLIIETYGARMNGQAIAPLQSSYPADLEDVLPQLIEIMSSDDRDTKDALKSNIATFLRTIKYQNDIKTMDRRIETLEKALGYLNPSGKPNSAGKGM